MTEYQIYPILRKLIDDDNEALFITNKLINEITSLDNTKQYQKNPVIIGFAGKANSGKSTCQQLTKKLLKHELKVYSCNYAGTLKYICFNIFKDKLPRTSFFGNQAEKLKTYPNCFNLCGRKILQTIGTDIIREYYGVDFWVKCLFNKIPDDIDVVIIGDCRFDNEVEEIKKRNGIVIKLVCPSENESINHISENTDKLYSDFVIVNNKTYIYKLKNELKDIIEKINDKFQKVE